MDLATIIGFVLGLILLGAATIMGGGLDLFFNTTSLLVVVLGTLASVLIKHKMSEVFSALAVMLKTVIVTMPRTEEIIQQIVEMANIARKDGILALERFKSRDAFLQAAINHCVDGADPEFLENILYKELEFLIDRHRRGSRIWLSVAEFAPAYGLLGTLLGLVQMLSHMEDPTAVGPAMATALVATFYGIVLANFIALPIAGKLQGYSQDEQLNMQVIIDGMIGIQKGINPRMLSEALKTALSPTQRERMR